MNCADIILEVIQSSPMDVRVYGPGNLGDLGVSVEGYDQALMAFRGYSINFALLNAKIIAILPDSLARVFGSKEFCFDLYNINSIAQMGQFINAVVTVVDKLMPSFYLSDEDVSVIVDLFLERLPMVWQDAVEEIRNGKSLANVMKEMENGHVIRILRTCRYDVDSWLKEFEEFNA